VINTRFAYLARGVPASEKEKKKSNFFFFPAAPKIYVIFMPFCLLIVSSGTRLAN